MVRIWSGSGPKYQNGKQKVRILVSRPGKILCNRILFWKLLITGNVGRILKKYTRWCLWFLGHLESKLDVCLILMTRLMKVICWYSGLSLHTCIQLGLFLCPHQYWTTNHVKCCNQKIIFFCGKPYISNEWHFQFLWLYLHPWITLFLNGSPYSFSSVQHMMSDF